MLWLVIFLYIAIIFPIFINVKLFYLTGGKKIYCLVSLFNKFKIISGYVTLNLSEIVLNLSSSKSIIIPYKNLFISGNFKLFKDFHVFSFFMDIDYGCKDQLEKVLIYKGLIEILLNNFYVIIKNKKDYLRLEFVSGINFSAEESKIYIKTNLVLNLLTVIFTLIKTLSEKIKNGIVRSKQSKYGFSNGV